MISPTDDECKGCLTKKISGTSIVECCEKKECTWGMGFGGSQFCLYFSKLGALTSGIPEQGSIRGR